MTIFSRIVAGEIPSYKIAEDENYYAFLDISPLQKGHTLVIPKREVDYIFDLTDEEIGAMQIFAKKVAVAIREVLPCIKVGQAVLGLEVPHAHIHLVPMQSEKDLNFANAKLSLPAERGTIVCNPPYGERMMEQRSAQRLYRAMGKHWKYADHWNKYIISSEPEFEYYYGAEATKKRKLYNGRLQCNVYMYYSTKR